MNALTAPPCPHLHASPPGGHAVAGHLGRHTPLVKYKLTGGGALRTHASLSGSAQGGALRGGASRRSLHPSGSSAPERLGSAVLTDAAQQATGPRSKTRRAVRS